MKLQKISRFFKETLHRDRQKFISKKKKKGKKLRNNPVSHSLSRSAMAGSKKAERNPFGGRGGDNKRGLDEKREETFPSGEPAFARRSFNLWTLWAATKLLSRALWRAEEKEENEEKKKKRRKRKKKAFVPVKE